MISSGSIASVPIQTNSRIPATYQYISLHGPYSCRTIDWENLRLISYMPRPRHAPKTMSILLGHIQYAIQERQAPQHQSRNKRFNIVSVVTNRPCPKLSSTSAFPDFSAAFSFTSRVGVKRLVDNGVRDRGGMSTVPKDHTNGGEVFP